MVTEGVDTSRALDLSESEDEEELEDMIEDFAAATADQDVRVDSLFIGSNTHSS